MINLKSRFVLAALACGLIGVLECGALPKMRILNFQADHGFAHESKPAALSMVESLGEKNGWQVVTTVDAASLTQLNVKQFDVIVFNNNCGNEGPVMTPEQQRALQAYIRSGGGFLGIHCAGALWKEGGEFQAWYEGLIGTTLMRHPKVQEAVLHVEDRSHVATRHLPEEWIVKDEWHRFGSNPREKVQVLISVDENSYEGVEKMGGDHPFTWCHEYDGGRSFFTSLGHTVEIYADENFQKLIEGAIRWAGDPHSNEAEVPLRDDLLLDLDAARGVRQDADGRVLCWSNQAAGSAARDFVPNDKGRELPGSGVPSYRSADADRPFPVVCFERQELVNPDEDAFDSVIQGSGHTWYAVLAVDEQLSGAKNTHAFFGNLRNTDAVDGGTGGSFEGFWGVVMDDRSIYAGVRNGVEFKRNSPNNPEVVSRTKLEKHRFYLVAGRMGSGTGTVPVDVFVNRTVAEHTASVGVNPKADSSKMAIGQERDATNHPGGESFDGELARLLIYGTAHTAAEMDVVFAQLMEAYRIRK